MIPRPTFRLPIWAALAIVLAAYVGRAVVLRGGDFSPDLPSDAIVGVALLVGIGGVAYLRSRLAREDADEPAGDDAGEV